MSKTYQSNIQNFFDDLLKEHPAAGSPSLEIFSHCKRRYEKKGPLGQGAMKSVFKVYDHFTCRELAMAELLNPDNSLHLDAFLHEARLTSQLDHPNIIQIHDIGLNEKGQPFYTMDLKIGQSLKSLCRLPKATNLNDRLTIFIQICHAVSYAHSKDIVHLDLKPENIHIGSFGEVVVCDWGLGTTTRKLSLQQACEQPFYQNLILSKPVEDRLSGTPGFMAPEQYQPDQKNDKLSDLFSLGALLYFIITGQKPFTGSLETIQKKTVAGDFPSPASINPQIPDSLEAICLKALHTDKQNRYQSAESLHHDIQKFMTGFTTSAEKTGFIKEATRLIKRNTRICSTVFIFLLILTLSTLYFIDSLRRSNLMEKQARQAGEKAIALYEKEKDAVAELDLQYARHLQSETEKLRDVLVYNMPVYATNEAIKKAQHLLKRQPENDETKKLLAYLSICSFKFLDAQQMLSTVKNSELRGVSNYRGFMDSLEPSLIKNSLPTPEEFLNILEKLRLHCSKRRHLTAKMFIYYSTKRQPTTNLAKITAGTLHFYNPEWNPVQFQYNSTTAALKISGSQFSTICMTTGKFTVNFLSTLNLKHLDLSGTNFYSPSQLKGLDRLESLNLADTLVKQMVNFKLVPHLKELTVSKNQFSAKKLKQVPKNVRLLIR